MEFFSAVDARGSQYPAFYFDTHISELKEEIESSERRLNTGQVPYEQSHKVKAEVERNKNKLEAIEKSKPHLSDGERDRLFKAYKKLSKDIGDFLFTRSDMMLGLATPHEEARRMVEYYIPTDGIEDLVKACRVRVQDKKMSRNGAAKVFKICGKLIGEPTNIEVLRKDKATVRTGAKTKAA